MIKKLAALADELDSAGEFKLANMVDELIADIQKEASPDKPLISPNKMSRTPEWCDAASKALVLLDQAMDLFTDNHVQVTTTLPFHVEELRRIVDYNKSKQKQLPTTTG
jgi:hypothetical protein